MNFLKILFGLNQSSDNSIEEKILEVYQEKTGEVFEYKKEFDLIGIEKQIVFNKYDILILNELLERQNTVTTDFLDDLTDKYPDLKIIFIVDSEEHEGDSYIKRLFNIGIYDIVCSYDLSMDILVDLIIKTRTKAEAKVYLNLRDTDDDVVESELKHIPTEELENILTYLDLVEKERILPTIRHIQNQYNKKQMIYLIGFLPEKIKDILKKDDEFSELVLMAEEKIKQEREKDFLSQGEDVKREQKDSIFSFNINPNVKTIQKKETIIQNQIIGSVFIGVANSIRGAGSTFVSMALASYIKKQGQSVSVIEMNPNPQLGNLSNDKTKNMITVKGIDIYYMKKKDNKFPIPPLMTNYKYIVADLGVLKRIEKGIYTNNNNYFEFLRSTVPILMVSGSLWKWGEVFPFLIDESFDNWTIYVSPTSNKLKKIIYKDLSQYSDKIYFLPYCADPYNLTNDICNVFDNSLGKFMISDVKKRRFKFPKLPKINLPNVSIKKIFNKE